MMLMCRLSLCLAIILMIQIDCSVYAEWVGLEGRYQSHPLQTVYIDPGTVHREGNVVILSALIDWKAMQGGRTPTRFYSTRLTKQVDCVGKLIQTVAAADYYGWMGTGELISGGSPLSEGRWIAVEPGTINDGLWQAACGRS